MNQPTAEPAQAAFFKRTLAAVLGILALFFLLEAVPNYGTLLRDGLSAMGAYDVTGFYLGLKAYWQQGLSPYESSSMKALARLEPSLASKYIYLPFLYNPIAVLIMKPLAALTLEQAKMAALIWNLLFSAVAAYLLWRLFRPYDLPLWMKVGLTIFVTFSPTQMSNTLQGQVNVFFVCLLLSVLHRQLTQGRLPAWLWLVTAALFSIKPQFAVMLLPLAAQRANWKPLLYGLGMLAVLVGVYISLEPRIWIYYQDALAGRIEGGGMAVSPVTQATTASRYNWSLSGAFKHLEIFVNYMAGQRFPYPKVYPLFTAFSLLFLGLHLALSRKRLLGRPWNIITGMAALGWWAYAFGPASWGHYQVFLFPLLLLACLQLPGRATAYFLLATCVLFLWVPYAALDFLYPDFPQVSRMLPGLLWAVKGSLLSMAVALQWAFLLWLDGRASARLASQA